MGKLFRATKRFAYFTVARYFRFWAAIHLNRWQPTIITVIGSSGKTTLLHLFEAELGDNARYSHKANSAFGIPFNILGLERKTFTIDEWFTFFIRAPFQAFRTPVQEKLYVAEADAERPGEGKFLAELLKPHVVVWVSLEEAHGVNFDRLVPATVEDERRVEAVKKVMAIEFGNFIEYSRGFVVLNKDNPFIELQAHRTKSHIAWVQEADIATTHIERDSVHFITSQGRFSVPHLVPGDVGLSVLAVVAVLSYIHVKVQSTFTGFTLPPGRSSVFVGEKNTTLIDSTYNATMGGMKAMLALFKEYPAKGEKWLVLGDMIEQGKSEAAEHEALAEYIFSVNPGKIILVGPRLAKHTYPLLVSRYGEKNVVSYMKPGEALVYLKEQLKGGETILFKGARYLEGIVEKLLQNQEDILKLCRREEIWVKRRKEWGM